MSVLYGKVMGSMLVSSASMLSTNNVITKDIKSCTYCCNVRCATLIVRLGGNNLAPKKAQFFFNFKSKLSAIRYHTRGITRSVSAQYGKVMGSMLGQDTMALANARQLCSKLGLDARILGLNVQPKQRHS